MLPMSTPSIESAASTADRYVKAAKASLEALREVPIGDYDLIDQHRREIEHAMDAAQVYSHLAIAEAVERSFPALPDALDFTIGGVPIDEDEINAKLREHVDQVEAHRKAELDGCPHVHCRMQLGGAL